MFSYIKVMLISIYLVMQEGGKLSRIQILPCNYNDNRLVMEGLGMRLGKRERLLLLHVRFHSIFYQPREKLPFYRKYLVEVFLLNDITSAELGK